MSFQTSYSEDAPTSDVVGFPKRRRMAAIALAVIVAVAAAGWYMGRFIQSPAEIAAATGPPEPSSILASAEMRLLTTDVVSRGTASFGSPQTLALATTKLKTAPAVVTDLPAADSTLAEGDVALTVSERPVFLLQGRQPSYRDLGPGMAGQDVRQLEAALERIGLNPGPIDGTFDASTAAAVTRMYSRAGYEPLVATETQLAAVRSREADLIQGARAYSGVQVPADEVVFADHTPLRVSELSVRLGDQAAGDLINATDSTVSVRGLVPLDERRLVKKGMKVVIDEPALGIKTTGRVSRVAATPGTDGADNFHVSFDVQVPKPPPNLVGTSVRLTIPVESSKGPVLAVPLSAVSLAADGSSRVERSVDGTVESLKVEPGLVANGYVEVSAAAGTLSEGDQVVVGADLGVPLAPDTAAAQPAAGATPAPPPAGTTPVPPPAGTATPATSAPSDPAAPAASTAPATSGQGTPAPHG